MKKKLIIAAIILLLILFGALIIYNGLVIHGKASEEERVLYTDAPGDVAGKDYIDGEVFIIDKDDPFFEVLK